MSELIETTEKKSKEPKWATGLNKVEQIYILRLAQEDEVDPKLIPRTKRNIRRKQRWYSGLWTELDPRLRRHSHGQRIRREDVGRILSVIYTVLQ